MKTNNFPAQAGIAQANLVKHTNQMKKGGIYGAGEKLDGGPVNASLRNSVTHGPAAIISRQDKERVATTVVLVNSYALALLNQVAVRAHSEGRAPARTLRTSAVDSSEYRAPAAPVAMPAVTMSGIIEVFDSYDKRPGATMTPGGHTKRGLIRKWMLDYLVTGPAEFLLSDALDYCVTRGYEGSREGLYHHLHLMAQGGLISAPVGRHGKKRTYTRL